MERHKIEHNKAPSGDENEIFVPIVEEMVHIDKDKKVSGRLRVEKTIGHRSEDIEIALMGECIEVDRIRIDRFIDSHPPVREEGDLTIFPVVEEVLVVSKRLRLREEVHLRKIQSIRKERRQVDLRKEKVSITREDSEMQR